MQQQHQILEQDRIDKFTPTISYQTATISCYKPEQQMRQQTCKMHSKYHTLTSWNGWQHLCNVNYKCAMFPQ